MCAVFFEIKSSVLYPTAGSAVCDEKTKIAPAQKSGGKNAFNQCVTGFPPIVYLSSDFFCFQNIDTTVTCNRDEYTTEHH